MQSRVHLAAPSVLSSRHMTGCYFLLVAVTVHRIHTDLTGLYSKVNRYLFFVGGGGGGGGR